MKLCFDLDEENAKFILTMASISRASRAATINRVITAYRKEHTDLYSKAMEVLDALGATPEEGTIPTDRKKRK